METVVLSIAWSLLGFAGGVLFGDAVRSLLWRH